MHIKKHTKRQNSRNLPTAGRSSGGSNSRCSSSGRGKEGYRCSNGVRQEKVTVVSGNGDNLKDYSVVCGSFGLKANAEGLKDFLDAEGYNATIAFNAESAMYRVIVSTFADRTAAAQAL